MRPVARAWIPETSVSILELTRPQLANDVEHVLDGIVAVVGPIRALELNNHSGGQWLIGIGEDERSVKDQEVRTKLRARVEWVSQSRAGQAPSPIATTQPALRSGSTSFYAEQNPLARSSGARLLRFRLRRRRLGGSHRWARFGYGSVRQNIHFIPEDTKVVARFISRILLGPGCARQCIRAPAVWTFACLGSD